MRVEHCGDLLLEPSSLHQQPSTISSYCSDHQPSRNIQFSELNQIEVPIIGCKSEYIVEKGGQRGVFGFTLSEEEWSLFSKSHLADLEPYERKKMCSLPKSFTPFSSKAVGDGGLESDRNLNRSASNSILLRKCESLNPTPSQFLLNGSEPNNNSIAHPSSLSKILLLRKSQEGFQEDEKENWLCDEGWNRTDTASVTEPNAETINDSAPIGDLGTQGSLLWEGFFQIGQNDLKEPEIDVEFLPTTRFPITHSSSVVGTIGSHPNPIISCAADQVHYHQHQDLSTSQKASFPSTVYNFHSIDPVLYAEYDDWNANVASLCENNADSTPVLYPDVLSVNMSGFAVQPAPESGFGSYAAYGENEDSAESGRAVEEVNTLSTFLSKFDDKVAAIWGQGSARSTLGANLLSVDGCISSASTPLGSSNPWGTPSSDVSTTHGSSEFRFMQTQPTKQISLAADALLSGGYALHSHQDHTHFEVQSNSQSANKITICDPTISPPKGNYNIMHSMKQYFGTAPPESEYHIIKRTEATSSAEEMEESLAAINHDRENAGFVAFVYPSDSDEHQSKMDMNTVAKALDSIDQDDEGGEEWEIVEACTKGKPQGYDEDLLNSWKTHFRTVDQVETIASVRGIDLLEEPITAISARQINPNLPEYRLFDVEVDGEYRVFNRPGKTMFPIKYKVRRQYEKGNQTEELGVGLSPTLDPSQVFQAYKAASEWTQYLSVPNFEFTGTLGTLPQCTTPRDPRIAYECDNTADLQSTDWYTLSKGSEYSGMWGEWVVGEDTSNSLAPGGEYCDSGVDGVGSRSDFYDDMFGDYEGEFENFSGIGFSFPGFVAANDTDTDYGQFQDAASSIGCDASSLSGKQGKSNRRNKTRLRPCKYYFLEGSCRRGNDCKFSHDSVTCRYWAEGSCLKGHTCPYVHCFIDGKKLGPHDEYGLKATGTDKQYHLESETDFPALGSTKNTMLSSRQPMALGFTPSMGEGIRRLEDSLESLTVFTDSNSSVVEEEVNETRRLFLFERMRSSPPKSGATEKTHKKQSSGDSVKTNKNYSEKHRALDNREWSESSNRTLSKSKSLGDTNSSAPWMRNSVSRSSSHSSTTGITLGIPVKEKRKKKKH
ncbi:unnamed protein product [Orchesella dallaii]|uniref:RING-type E3 ubiquitin transferase n=1 Tax=Orchesella dallaii TaxID=48710 RepID=A0ABP1QQI1_9HEXA